MSDDGRNTETYSKIIVYGISVTNNFVDGAK
jgi:hypothetical protein